MKIYLAGPMTNLPFFNFPAFHTAAKRLRALGHDVFNPAEITEAQHGDAMASGNAAGDPTKAAADHGFDLRSALHEDLTFICLEADAIAFLPGWENSKGARAEHATGAALGLRFIYLSDAAE